MSMVSQREQCCPSFPWAEVFWSIFCHISERNQVKGIHWPDIYWRLHDIRRLAKGWMLLELFVTSWYEEKVWSANMFRRAADYGLDTKKSFQVISKKCFLLFHCLPVFSSHCCKILESVKINRETGTKWVKTKVLVKNNSYWYDVYPQEKSN